MQQGRAGTEATVAALARAAMAQGLRALAATSVSQAAGGNTVSAIRWLERAHRLVPFDPNATLTLASACLADDPARAASLFQSIAGDHDIRQAWLGLAAAHLRLAGPRDAAPPLAVVLSRHAFAADAAGLADAIGCGAGSPGWCALRADGRLEIRQTPPNEAPTKSCAPGRRTSAKAAASHGALERDPRRWNHRSGESRSQTTGWSGDREPMRTETALTVALDGKPVHGTILPDGWERGQRIDVRAGDVPLLGSPIRVDAIRRIIGCVEVHDGGIRGWAWHPGDPETSPTLTLRDPSGRVVRSFVASDESIQVADTGPLARPRSFLLTGTDLSDVPGPIHVIGPDGKDLPGSPLDPFADQAAHVSVALHLGKVYPAASPAPASRSRSDAGLSRSRPRATLSLPAGETATAGSSALRADARAPAEPVGADGRKRAVTIVIPVHDGGAVVLACLHSVLASVPAAVRVLVVDDGSADPAMIAALDNLARRRKITLRRHPAALGFPAAANAGIRAASGRDVVLLNSDTLVPPNWLERLREAAYADRDIGTVTPLSNDASILGYPGPSGTNAQPGQAATNRLDRAANRANGATVTDIPVGVGFCLYLRRDCLNAVGTFRSDLFAQGYGEENDLCLRARRLGWRNVALTGLFVGHVGGTSFGPSATHLRARNSRIVEQLHPGYHALVHDYLARDPLAEPRRRIDLQLWRDRSRKRARSAILITHDGGGGVEQRLIHAIKAHDYAGRRPIVLRPAEAPGGEPAIAVRDGMSDDLPNLVYAMPRELPALLRLLRATQPETIEAHHFADYPPAIYDLVTHLGVPYDVHIHDYAWFCPRISLVGANGRYCGEPDLLDCEACVADNGHFLNENIAVAALRRRSAAFLSAARRVVVPSDDTGKRMRRHFDGLATITVPHEDDAAIPPPAAASATRPANLPRGRASICVVGGIGVHKGYDVLLACARDAQRRDLDLEFVVVGHTIDDARMLATERVFVTGRFEPDEAVAMIASQNARLGFIASICPETWCLSLGDIWRAGLKAAAFDIGAPAERIRRTGRGILLPLGLSASAINNVLVAVAWTAAH